MIVNNSSMLAVWLIFLILGLPQDVNADLDSEIFTPPVAALTLEHLLAEDRVRIKSWIQPNDGAAVGQQLELNIEVATNSWFSGGTRIGRFELDDAIVLRRNKFAVNSSHREQGNTWSVQLWTVTIYPQRAGRFAIPEIDVNVSVANPDDPTVAVSGVIQTESLDFSASLPAGVADTNIKQWVASNNFTVSDEFDKPLDSNSSSAMVNAGDAIRRTISLRAENVAAMMLPEINVSSISGLAAYRRPARLEDRVNRGTYTALRREVISYVAEYEGVYTLPEITLHWWNTETLSLEQIVLAAQQIHVGSAGPGGGSFVVGSSARTTAYIVLASFMIVGLVYLCFRFTRLKQLLQKLKSLAFPLSSQMKRDLIRSYPGSDPAAHGFQLLQWLEAKGLGSKQSIREYLSSHPNSQLSLLFEQIMQHAFGNSGSPLSAREFGFFIDELDRSSNCPESNAKQNQPYLNPRHI